MSINANGLSSSSFSVAACITTMHRPSILDACLTALSLCNPPPGAIVVSDDSKDPSMIEATMGVVAKFSNVIYVRGPRRGVCANRNRALDQVQTGAFDFVTFLDDDTLVPTDFFAAASAFYRNLPLAEQRNTIITGSRSGADFGPVRLNFRSYFEACEEPESVTVASSIFPMSMLAKERWDENIFFGSEDAELCLRALKRGYKIKFASSLFTSDLAADQGVLLDESTGGMSKYAMYCEAARLYIGIKRYSKITPNPVKLIAFIALYFAHMTVSLARKRMLRNLVPIVRLANLTSLARSPAKVPVEVAAKVGSGKGA